jgi:hypothetical protein
MVSVPEKTPSERLAAALDWNLQRSSAQSRDMGKAFERSIPDKTKRNAIALLVDAGMDVEKIRGDLAQLPEKTPTRIRRAYEAALDLSKPELERAQQIKTYFDQRLQDAAGAP